jgi:lipid-binding SYLF domain-containing protein
MRYTKASPMTALALLTLCFRSAGAEDAFENDASAALTFLCRREPVAKWIGEKAKAVLVFPNTVNPRFILRGQYGEGELLANGKPIAHYQSVGASYGLPDGAQSWGCALFFMNDNALQCLDKSDGWEIGVGPSILVVDKAIAKSLTGTALENDVYAFIFDRNGLIPGAGIRGTKIIKLRK